MTSKHDLPDLNDFGTIPDPLPPPARAAEQPAAPLPRAFVEDAPGRAAVRSRRAGALAVSLGWLGLHLAVYGVRTDFSSLPSTYLATQIVLPLVLAAAALAVATAAGKLGLGPNVGVLVTLALVAPASFLMIALGAPPPRDAGDDGSFWLGALVCLDITLAWAAVPLLVAAVSLRHAFPAASRWRAALVGGACGLVSGAVMNLHCANVDPFHIALGHGIPVLVATGIGAFVLSRWVRI